jgi:aminoglycoside 3-N-acetyltransferase
MMPAMSWRAVNLDNPHWYERDTPAITGILSEVFRQKYASHRSIHPTHSVSGFGVAATSILSDHEIDPTPCSANSPYGHLAKLTNGFVILLGVGMDSCTLVHHGEETAAPDLYLKPDVESYACHRVDGSTIMVQTRRHMKLYRNFWRFEDILAARKLVTKVELGGTAATAFSAAAMIDVILNVLAVDPTGTIAKPGERSKLM